MKTSRISRTAFATLSLLVVACSDGESGEGGSPEAASAEGAQQSSSKLQGEPVPECLFELTPLSASDATPGGIKAADLAAMVKSGTANLTWSDGSSTTLTLELSEPRFYALKSSKNPAFDGESDDCRDGARAEFPAKLSTSDGRIRLSTTLRADATDEEPRVARATSGFPKAEFAGVYVAAAEASGECVVRAQLSLEFSAAGFHGQVIEAVAQDACNALKATTGVGPRYVGRW